MEALNLLMVFWIWTSPIPRSWVDQAALRMVALGARRTNSARSSSAIDPRDVEKATRLRRGSLYNAFGDKEGLFVAAFKRYESTVGAERIRQLSLPDPYRAIEGFLNVLVEQMSEPNRPRGCLHTNTSLEFPSAPEAVLKIVAERTRPIENAIHLVLARAQEEGLIDAAADVRALACFYLGVAKGIGVLHKAFGDVAM